MQPPRKSRGRKTRALTCSLDDSTATFHSYDVAAAVVASLPCEVTVVPRGACCKLGEHVEY